MKFRNLIFLAAALAFSMPAWADGYTYNLVTGNGITGPGATYTVQGTTIIAAGHVNGANADLFFKNGGGSETGLGLAATSDFEISGSGFIQFDLNQLLVIHPTSVAFTFGSVSPGEIYNVWGSNTMGAKGTLLGSGTANAMTFDLPALGSNRNISVSAQTGNVLVDTITAKSADVPEPRTSSLAIAGLMAILAAGMFFRRAGLRDRIAF